MVKIAPLRTNTTSHLKRSKKAGSGSGFSVGNADKGQQADVASGVSSVSQMNPLFQLMQIQEVGDYSEGTKKAVLKGEELLGVLEELQTTILSGDISKSSLEKIVDIAAKMPADIKEPGLREVLARIKQRAMVEVAKIEMSVS